MFLGAIGENCYLSAICLSTDKRLVSLLFKRTNCLSNCSSSLYLHCNKTSLKVLPQNLKLCISAASSPHCLHSDLLGLLSGPLDLQGPNLYLLQVCVWGTPPSELSSSTALKIYSHTFQKVRPTFLSQVRLLLGAISFHPFPSFSIHLPLHPSGCLLS